MMRYSRIISMFFLTTTMALIGGCDINDPVKVTEIKATLVNASGNNIHIIAPDEEASLSNRLAPGQSRVVFVTNRELGHQDIVGPMHFVAIRNDMRMAASGCFSPVIEGVGGEGEEPFAYEDITVTYTEEIFPEGTLGALGCG